jgi:hypothetical protein
MAVRDVDAGLVLHGRAPVLPEILESIRSHLGGWNCVDDIFMALIGGAVVA